MPSLDSESLKTIHPHPHLPPSQPDLESSDLQSIEVYQPAISITQGKATEGISLTVYCLGSFQIYQDDQPIVDWPNGVSKSVFKYLITHREHPIAKEVLMDIFWPDANPNAARNNLNVAIYGLRKSLRKVRPDFSHILYQSDHYLINPKLRIWIDFEEFLNRIRTAQKLEQRGDLVEAIREYRNAEVLYQGDLLEEDRYEEWLLLQRQSLQDNYLSLLDRLSRYDLDQENIDACITSCKKILAIDPCRENAHRCLMICYDQQGQPNLALRQYHLCATLLKDELDVSPSQETKALYQKIRQRQ
jgi:DNA-binding SARP family transcriptional activator